MAPTMMRENACNG